MKTEHMTIPPEAAAAARAGNLIEAIKITREATGLSLKEAKELVEKSDLKKSDNTYAGTPRSARMPSNAVSALHAGRYVDAVKHYRQHNRTGLKDAKEAVDRYLNENPSVKQQFKNAASAHGIPILGIIWLCAFIVLCVSGYYWLMGES